MGIFVLAHRRHQLLDHGSVAVAEKTASAGLDSASRGIPTLAGGREERSAVFEEGGQEVAVVVLLPVAE